MADFWYGADAAFPKAVQWHAWYEHHAARLGSLQPVEKFVVDATTKLQQTMVKMAQRIRKNLDFTRSYTEGEMADIMAVAGEAAAWYRRNRPAKDAIRNLDPILLILFEALDGAYAVQERLAHELDQINRKGYLLVDTSSERQEAAS